MWYTATSASVTNGSDVVTITTGDDISIVQEKSGLVFEDSSPVEVLKAYIDTGSNKVIQLAKPWPYSTKTNQPLVAYPTDADFAAATAELRRVIDSLEKAGTTEAQAGTDDEKFMTALKTKQAINFNTGTAASADVTTNSTDTTEGRLTTVGWGGYGGSRLSKSVYGDDLNILMQNDSFNGMIMEVAASTTANKPEIAPATLAGYVVKYGVTVVLYSQFPESERGSVYTGYWDGNSISWVKSLDTNSANFSYFVFESGDRKLGVGRENGGEVYIELPLNSPTAPSSVSITGEFTLYDINNQSIVSSNVVPSFKGFSSNKNLILGVIESVVAGNNYYITPTSGTTATIKVNF